MRSETRDELPILIARGEWIRNRPRNRRFAAVYRALAALYVVMAAASLIGFVELGWIACLLAGLAFSVVAATAAGYAQRCLATGLLIGTDSVIVKNPLRTYELLLTQVERFVAGAQQAGGLGWNATPGVALVLRDNSRIFVWPLAQEGLRWNTEANAHAWESTTTALNQLLA